MSSMEEAMKVTLPDGESGDWKIQNFTVSKKDADRDLTRAMLRRDGRFTPAGKYVRLVRGKTTIMSNTPDEIRDHYEPYSMAKGMGGHVLINGLGLGMITRAVCQLAKVESVTVVENSGDVIELVGKYLTRYFKNLTIRHADAYSFQPPAGMRYSVVWHDIWDDLNTDNLDDMGTLHRKYGRKCDWQGSWVKELLRNIRRREQAAMRRYKPMGVEEFLNILGGPTDAL